MFVLEIVMQNIDPEYDVIVPLICACRRFAEVASTLPCEIIGEPLYRCKKLRGGVLHGFAIIREIPWAGADYFQCNRMFYGKSLISFDWDAYRSSTTHINLKYRLCTVVIDYATRMIAILNGWDVRFHQSFKDAKHQRNFISACESTVRAVLGMTPAEFLRLL